MFTGIVSGLGRVVALEKNRGDRRLTIEAPAGFLRRSKLGDSIAVNGVCLTVAGVRGRRFTADVSVETLDATTAKSWVLGDELNLEKALALGQPLGGHLVSGHVDGVGRLIAKHRDARSWRMEFSLSKPLARYVARKGSVCIDGVSLTINGINGLRFGVNIVPHTHQSTTLGRLQPGAPVNIEVDLIARYLERLRSP
jgi:riboflavin synthase